MDTQWPRYEVFVQEAEGKAHVHAGSVHATDPEIALLNARDVFVRRPECVSLWVVSASAVTEAMDTDNAASPSTVRAPKERGSASVAFQVFGKLEPKGELTHLGRVLGRDGDDALREARAAFAERRPIVLWVVEDRAIERSAESDAAPLFDPAHDKPFRDQSFYPIQTALRRLKDEGRDDS